MNYKSILILGYGVSGKSAAKALLEKGLDVYVYDDRIKTQEDIVEDQLNNKICFLLNSLDVFSQEFDLIMKSPGIKPTNEIISKLLLEGKKIVSDIEIGYIFKNDQELVGVTGTNGKTTTTSLINDIINHSNKTSKAVGNIGLGAVDELINSNTDYLVIECSSFQLNDIDTFRPKVGVLTNITSDHLDYHGTFESYKKAKFNILKNLTKDDFGIINVDDKNLENIKGSYKKIEISGIKKVNNGFFYEEPFIYSSFNGQVNEVVDTRKLQIKGLHNYYNVMCALGASYALDLDMDLVLEGIYNFMGVKHRLQFVDEINGVKYYNDSKGTNSDSTMKALASFSEPIVIILGGYDKKEDFRELLDYGKDKIKGILTFGKTSDYIYKLAKELGYEEIYKVASLKEAMNKSRELTEKGDILLLSPACASWDMYKSFEKRGEEFISLVEKMKE